MQFEIMDNTTPVSFEVANVSFPAYEAFKERAIEISEEIRAMEVNPENVKEAKTTLAEARKITDRLSRARIDIKKAILNDYQTFEAQVKEVSAIIGDADDALRTKVRQLEEAERQMKKEALRLTWNRRIERYPFISECLSDPFDRWLTPRHLNKTFTMKKAEADMVDWLEKTDMDLEAADAMGEEYLVEYIEIGNLPEAIQNVKNRQAIRESIPTVEKDEPTEEVACFVVHGTKDIKLVEMLLKENEIDFERTELWK